MMLNHYLVKEADKHAVIYKKFDDQNEATKHCMAYVKANDDGTVSWWVLSTSRQIPEGQTVDRDN